MKEIETIKSRMDPRKRSILDKIAGLGIKMKDNMTKEEFADFMFERLNKTVFKKRPIEREEMTVDLLMDILDKYDKKYKLSASYIMFSKKSDDTTIRCSLMIKNYKGEHITSMFARSVFEAMSKAVLYLYYITKD